MKEWRAAATEPLERECEVLEGLPSPVRARLLDATEPLEIEVQRVRFTPVVRRARWPMLVPATALFVGLAWAAVGMERGPRVDAPLPVQAQVFAVPVLSTGSEVRVTREERAVEGGSWKPTRPAKTRASVVPEETVALAGPTVPGPTRPSTVAAWFSGLLDRFEGGERSSALVGELGAFIREADNAALVEEAEVLALLVGAHAWPAQAALDALDAWIARHRRHPDEVRVLVARADVADRRLGRCDLALPTYRRLVRGTSGDLQDDARQRLQRCLQTPVLP